MNKKNNCFVIFFIVHFCITYGKMENEDNIERPSEHNITIQMEKKHNITIQMAKTNQKLDSIHLMIPDLEENINRTLFSLRNSILDKLEEYIDSKLNNLEINIPEKIKQYRDLNSDNTTNKSFEKLKENLNYKIDDLGKNISNQIERENNCKCEVVKNITDYEQKMNKKLEGLEKNIKKKSEENINLNFNALANNISKEFEGYITCNSDYFMKITDLENNINRKLEVFDRKIPTKLEENINLKLYALTRNISKELEINNNFILNALWNKTVTEIPDNSNVDCGKIPPLHHGSAELLNGTTNLGSVVQYSCATNYQLVGPARRTCTEDFQWSETAPTCEGLCKEQTVARERVTPAYSLDAVSLHYGTLRRDSAGRRVHFELHFALQTDGALDIDLKEREEENSGLHHYINVGADSPQRTSLHYYYDTVQDISTPDILSATEFRSFYIKVDDGKLQFGKEGDPPLISYSGVDLDLLNFYRFDTYGGPTSIRFCPAAVEGSS